MKLEEVETYKYRAESLKQVGFALCTPFSILLIQAIPLQDWVALQSVGFVLTAIMFTSGFLFINRSLTIMDLIEREN
ncbi:MAG: hypothetical protein HRT47_12605 [Candidatus Caenarcaniphilales bacterium]|nr:hypothetical protein [Candidatus Caenarcaniphilales bacterium]